MKLYNIELPDPKPENAIKIIKTCRDIHQLHINRRKKETKRQKWDRYWVEAYNAVITELKKHEKKTVRELSICSVDNIESLSAVTL